MYAFFLLLMFFVFYVLLYFVVGLMRFDCIPLGM